MNNDIAEFKRKTLHLIEKAKTDVKLIEMELDELYRHIGLI